VTAYLCFFIYISDHLNDDDAAFHEISRYTLVDNSFPLKLRCGFHQKSMLLHFVIKILDLMQIA